MTSKNPLDAKVVQYQTVDCQAKCDQLNMSKLAYQLDWYWFVRKSENANGDVTETIDHIELPIGTKSWIRENQAKVKGLIRKLIGQDGRRVEECYQRALQAAPVPIPWKDIPIR